ncbi:MAG: cell envelope biogenesis protein TolA, partial [Paracoccaceae bacterium]|nr:cell envelope biogenesis protein TolA [Paracoccaceae bacterium]
EPAAPPPTTTEIVTEADTPGAGGGALAPEISRRPRARPERLAAAAAPEPEPAPVPAPEPEPSVEDTIAEAAADAVAEALAAAQSETTSEQGGSGLAASGPPLTSGERDAFRIAVQGCWVVDPGSEASRISVTLAFELDQAGKVVSGPEMISDSGGSEAAVRTAFEAARRAILRCQRGGFALPAEKYEQWREVEMTFDASGGRIR